MNGTILQLYPPPARELTLENLYLSHALREKAQSRSRPFVYSNYVTSLDGRIAIAHPSGSGMVVPDQIANPRDWRLFQELAVQADILITSGRYLRNYFGSGSQDILRVYDDPQLVDLRTWREAQGLPPYPDLAVVSNSLDFPIPDELMQDGRSIVVVTTEHSDSERRKQLETLTGTLIVSGNASVDGLRLIEELCEMGYQLIYNSTGPKVLHFLLSAGVLNRLYLTLPGRILGGSLYATIVEGSLLNPARDFRIENIYYDQHALDGIGQLFLTYDQIET